MVVFRAWKKIFHLSYPRFMMIRSFSSLADDTIFALSSGHGKCGVAVLRVSGTQTLDVVKKFGKFSESPLPRQAILRKLAHPDTGEPIDKGLILWFPGPKSFTGEDCAEFHIHGGSAVIAAMVTAMGSIQGCRHAEAGEFTKRAFSNGKLDLTEVEGLADLIHAETEAQRKQALRQMDGDLSKIYCDWSKRLVKHTADVEAYIDFGEDENIEDGILDDATAGVKRIVSEIQAHLSDNRQGERLRNGVHVTIVGEPNVGKSSLLNSICQRPAAIVSPIAGTTRDVVETALNIGGYPVLLSDTAGLRETSDAIEQEGVRRALARSQQADITVLVLEAPYFLPSVSPNLDLTTYVTEHLVELGIIETNKTDNTNSIDNDRENEYKPCNRTHVNDKRREDFKRKHLENIIVVINKSDLVDRVDFETICRERISFDICSISCTTDEGIVEFLDVLKDKVAIMCGNPLSGNPSLTQARHRTHLNNCVQHLNMYMEYIEDDIVLAAQGLRKTLREIGKITGKISSEDILDVIFRDFCIGK